MATFLSFCQWLADTLVQHRHSRIDLDVSRHRIGPRAQLVLFVGLLLLWDLRLLGITLPRVAVSEVWARLIPWITVGAVLMVVSGLLLFPLILSASTATSSSASRPPVCCSRFSTRWRFTSASNADWSIGTRLPITPRAAKFAGAISIALWAAIVVTGRFVAYNWFPPMP